MEKILLFWKYNMRMLTSFLIGICMLLGVGNMVYAVGPGNWWQPPKGPLHCAQGKDCTLEKWFKQAPKDVTGIETKRDGVTYVQDIVKYLMGFVSLVGVFYILYAGFRVLTGWWDDEAQTDAKKTIIAVAIGIILMWLARALVMFILRMLG